MSLIYNWRKFLEDTELVRLLPTPNYISKKAQIIDIYASQAIANTLLPAAIFGTLTVYDPKAAKALATFMGPNMLVAMPTINLVISLLPTAIESLLKRSICCRVCRPTLGEKEDSLVKVPLPGTRPLTRVEAWLIIIEGFILQTIHNSLMEFDPDLDGEQIFNRIASDALFGYLGQYLLGVGTGWFIDKCILKKTFEVEYLPKLISEDIATGELKKKNNAAIKNIIRGQAVITTLLPTVIFGLMAIYDKDDLKDIAGKMGKALLALIPLFSLILAGAIGLGEGMIRSSKGWLRKAEDVFVPFPGMRNFSVREANYIIILGFFLQTFHALLQDFEPNAEGEEVFHKIASNTLFAFAGKLSLGIVADKVHNQGVNPNSFWNKSAKPTIKACFEGRCINHPGR